MPGFPILAKENLFRAAGAVADRFGDDKRSGKQKELNEIIATPVVEAATSKNAPALIADFATRNGYGERDGQFTCVKSKGQIFTFHQKMVRGVLELRLYPPLSGKDFDLSRLQSGGVGKLYGKKDGGDVPRITLDIGTRVKVYMNGEPQEKLDGDWGRGVAEVALTLIERARASARRDDDVVEIEPGVTQARAAKKPLGELLVSATPRVEAKNLPGHQLDGAESWRGQPVLVTSDRGGKVNMNVLVERGLEGESAFWPIATPADPAFPKKGAAVFLDGDTLHLVGGVDAEGKVSNAHWTVDLSKATSSRGAAEWKLSTPLKDATAWAVAVLGSRDAFIIGGVAGYYLKRVDGGDERVQTTRRALTVGGFGNWRERAAPPADPTGAFALAADVDGWHGVFVGPGAAKDGAVTVYDENEQAWFKLPNLPEKVGMGQLHLSGRELVYTGGFLADGDAASREVFSINLDDVFGGWQRKGESDAVSGAARVVDRRGKKVSYLVAPKGALVAHLE